MAKRKHKKKKFLLDLYVIAGLVILAAVIGLFLFFYYKGQEPEALYVYPENVKQGDTIFIKAKSPADNITGNFGDEKLVFYKKDNSNEWISFLGIDADQTPGDYRISVNTSKTSQFTNYIKVALADFSSAPAVQAPSAAQNGITKEKAVDNIVKNDNPILKKILSNLTPEPYFKGSFSFPLSKMERSGLSFGKFIGFAKDKLQHLGVDLKAAEKTDIFAVNDGKVVAVLNLSNYGKTVIIDHGLDIFSLYLHLDEFKVSEGDMVKRGQTIGLSGETGYATAPHLHFSIRVGNSRVDPVVFIETTQKLDENFILAALRDAFFNIINSFK